MRFHDDFSRMEEQRLPDLKLVADLSHFSTVVEREPPLDDDWGSTDVYDLDDPNYDRLGQAIRHLIPHFAHIQGRVASSQASQVDDPRLPFHQERVHGFERWWKAIWQYQQQQLPPHGFLSFTLEHGPPPYQPEVSVSSRQEAE